MVSQAAIKGFWIMVVSSSTALIYGRAVQGGNQNYGIRDCPHPVRCPHPDGPDPIRYGPGSNGVEMVKFPQERRFPFGTHIAP